jgi:c-di-GMP-binding flagellar brake protein YcgR
LAAEVYAQEAEALVLVPREIASGPPPASPVTVVFQNRAGVFSFRTRVRSAEGGVLRLDQVEGLQRTQRRRYYRRRLRLPVKVQTREGEPPLESQLLDLGGEGASLVNPGRRLSAGDLAELAFRVGGESFRLTAEVLRVSRDGQVLHVRFHGLRDADRDRLLGILFRSLGEASR